MPSPPLSNTFEGGSDGTEITTSNSGGASGDIFTISTNGTDQTCTFENTQARDTLSMLSASGAAPSGSHYRGWDALGSLTGSVYVRFYMYIGAHPAATMWLCRAMTSAAAVSGSVLIRAGADGGVLRASNAANTALTAGTVGVATGQWVRIEWRIISSTTTGEIEWRLYNSPESTSIDDSVSLTSQALGANTDQMRIGMISGASGNTNYNIYFDNFAVSTSDWIGPADAGGASQRFRWRD